MLTQKKHLLSSGFSIIEVFFVLTIVAMAAGIGAYVLHARQSAYKTYDAAIKTSNTSKSPSKTNLLTISDADNNKSVTVTKNQTFSAQLGSTYWTFDALPNNIVLSELGSPVRIAKPRSFAGSGAGTITAKFRAMSSGTVVISAHRNSCGEALGCSPEQGVFKVTINIK